MIDIQERTNKKNIK